MSRESERLRSSWIANASAWRDAVREQRIESRRLVTDAAIVAAVLEQQPQRVLDLGCGEGWLMRSLAAHGIAVTGIDASQPLIEAARELGGGELAVMSYEEVIARPPAGPFDAVVANFSLLDDHVEELLRAVGNSLPPDGHVIIQTVHPLFVSPGEPYADGWRTETFDGLAGKWRESMPWYFRTIASWVRTITNAGYTLAEIREPQHATRPASLLFIGVRRR